MSHFAVTVITKEEPNEEILTKALQPFHEFECTGSDDEYVKDVDITDEIMKEYNSETCRKYKDQNGNLFDPWQANFFRDPTAEEISKIGHNGRICGSGSNGSSSWDSRDWGDGKGYRAKMNMSAEEVGMTEVSITKKDSMTFETFLEDYHGYKLIDEGKSLDLKDKHKYGYAIKMRDGSFRVIRRTNPNDKWDWWTTGGRYSSRIKLKAGGFENSAKKTDIDFQGMKDKNCQEVIGRIQESLVALKAKLNLTDDQILSIHKHASKAYREIYPSYLKNREHQQKFGTFVDDTLGQDHPLSQAIRFGIWYGGKESLCGYFEGAGIPETEEDPFDYARSRPGFSTFAFLTSEGEWIQRGDMGWWACVSNEKDPREWDATCEKIIDSIPGDHYLTVVDCHI